MFNRVLPTIMDRFRQEVLTEDIQTKLECTSRNATFQKRLIETIDAILETEVNAEGSCRRFSKRAIDDKLAEQGHACPLCKLAIASSDKYEGDHIVPWTAGGKTVAENLQVVHRRCHQLKSV
jgi:5-methylcytosine-specific restriction endonuclease McrA